MSIGFDAKRAFLNNTGVGNYSRDSIRVLSNYFSNNEYFLYTPNNTKNNRTNCNKVWEASYCRVKTTTTSTKWGNY